MPNLLTTAIKNKIAARDCLPPPDERRAIRTDLGLAQLDLAQALGVGLNTFSRWERGDRRPSAPHAEEYAELLAELRRYSGGAR